MIPAGTPNSPSSSNAGLIACRNLTLAPGAALSMLAGDTLVVGGAANVQGAASGAGLVSFQGPTAGSIAGGGSLPSVQINKNGSTAVNLSGSVTVNGTLALTGGTFLISQAAVPPTMTVNGDATFSAGTLTPFNAGILDVNGSVTFAGTACTQSPSNFFCSGDWTSNAAYAPTSGLVTFDGTLPQPVTGTRSPGSR